MSGCRRIGFAGDRHQRNFRRCHNIGIEIDEQHAERDWEQQQRFILSLDGEIQQKDGYGNHNIVLPVEIGQTGAGKNTVDGV